MFLSITINSHRIKERKVILLIALILSRPNDVTPCKVLHLYSIDGPTTFVFTTKNTIKSLIKLIRRIVLSMAFNHIQTFVMESQTKKLIKIKISLYLQMTHKT